MEKKILYTKEKVTSYVVIWIYESMVNSNKLSFIFSHFSSQDPTKEMEFIFFFNSFIFFIHARKTHGGVLLFHIKSPI